MKKNDINILVGAKGTGMGLFSIMMALKVREHFSKVAVLDYRTQPIFGNYIPFTRDMFINEKITGD